MEKRGFLKSLSLGTFAIPLFMGCNAAENVAPITD